MTEKNPMIQKTLANGFVTEEEQESKPLSIYNPSNETKNFNQQKISTKVSAATGQVGALNDLASVLKSSSREFDSILGRPLRERPTG